MKTFRSIVVVMLLGLGAGAAVGLAAATISALFPGCAHGAVLDATPSTLAQVEAGARAGDVVRLAAGVYSTSPNPPVDGVSYLGDLQSPLAVRLNSRLRFQWSNVMVRGVDARAGVTFDLTATRDSLTDSRIGGDVNFREADYCGIARCTGDVSRIWFATRNESWASDSAAVGRAGRTVGPGVVDCRWTVLGSGSNHIVRVNGVDSLLWVRTRTVGSSSTTSGNSLRKIFYSNGCRFEDSYWDFTNVCATTCDESGGWVIRDKSQDHWFVRDTMILRGNKSDIWLTASGNAPNSETNGNNHFIGCVITNDTPGSIYYQNSILSDEIRNCTFTQRGAFWINACGSAGRNWTRPAVIEGTTFSNTTGGYALEIWDGGPFAAQLRMRRNTFVTTGTGAAAFISLEMATAGKLDSDSSTYWSAGPASSAMRLYRGCCGYQLSAVGAGTLWATASGQDIHSRFAAPTTVPPTPQPPPPTPAPDTTPPASIWFPLGFTAPDDLPSHQPVQRYVGYVVDQLGVRYFPRLYSAPSASAGPPAPRAAGLADTAWLYTSADGRARMARLFSVDAAGNVSDPSNPRVFAVGLRDTNYAVGRQHREWTRTSTLGGALVAAWSLPPGDTLDWEVKSQEQVQLADRARICQLFGYWALRGQRQVCPPGGAAAEGAAR